MADGKEALHLRVEHDLDYHRVPLDALVPQQKMERLRAQAKSFAHTVVEQCVPGREQSLALTAIEEACMWAIASVARNQRGADAGVG